MNGFDYVALASLVSACLRGYRQGLAAEFYRLFRMAVALVAGTSLYGLFSDAITSLLNISSGWTDPAMFLGVSALAWRSLRRMRFWMETFLRTRVTGSKQQVGGAIAAGLKAAILIGGVVTAFHLATWMPGHEAVAENSMAAKIVRPFLSEP